jgi:AraC-like DNA-binding protein
MRTSYVATKDYHRFTSPESWDFTILPFEPKTFWHSKLTYPLSPQCTIVKYDFRSRIRFRAALKSEGVQICFIDSYSVNASRLQGMGRIDSIVMITLGNYDWDGISDVGAFGLELNFGPSAAQAILNRTFLHFAHSAKDLFGKNRSIVLKPTPAFQRLKHLALRMASIADPITVPTIGNEDEAAFQDSSSLDTAGFNEEALIELSNAALEEVTPAFLLQTNNSSSSRRELALEVERRLWRAPSREADTDVSLDELALQTNASRRTIQLAIQEQFGVGFLTLRKIIRLHQLRMAIRSSGSSNISELGAKFYLSHFGRLSQEYKDLFGVLPSLDLRNARSKTTL